MKRTLPLLLACAYCLAVVWWWALAGLSPEVVTAHYITGTVLVLVGVVSALRP